MPKGFNLDAEKSRQEEAAEGGIITRGMDDENDAESPVKGFDGKALDNDDDFVEDKDFDEDLTGI
jgi:hypothetical protein